MGKNVPLKNVFTLRHLASKRRVPNVRVLWYFSKAPHVVN